MLQRSPSYIASKPAVDPIANKLTHWFGRWAARWWFILSTMFIYLYCRTFPGHAKKKIIADVKEVLGSKFEAKHFTPHYKPWDQRVCLCPDADFFEAIKADKASIETDGVAEFNKSGITLKSGKDLSADLIVTATGLQVQFLGGISFEVDDKEVAVNESYVYKGMMLSDMPNLFLAVGYTNASWTLKVDLTHRYASRIITHMDENSYSQCCARTDADMLDAQLIDLSSGYVQRSLDKLPKQAINKPWRLNQNFILDNLALRYSSVRDPQMEFS